MQIRKRHKILLLLAFLFTLNGSKAERPNILFIAVDDLKPLLGSYGNSQVISPNIDKLAEQGTTFTKSYCQWPVCGGSRASLMTGLYPESTGVMDLKTRMRDVNPDLITILQYFKENGYITAGVGKIYDPRCVDNKTDLDKPSWSIPFTKYKPSNLKDKDNKRFADYADCAENEMTDGLIAEEGVKLMKKVAAENKPFFLAVGFKKPHLPFISPKKYWDMYKRADFRIDDFQKIAANATKYNWHNSNEMRGYKEVPKVFSDDFQKEALHGYFACVSYVDAQVGLLLNQLKKLKLKRNTIVVFW